MRQVTGWCAIVALAVILFGVGRALPVVAQEPAQVSEIAEVEPNDSAESAQLLSTIGLNNPIRGSIPQDNPADIDWYAFTVEAGKFYEIELYNVDSGLNRTAGSRCSGSFRTYTGVALSIYDSSQTFVTSQCDPRGRGNRHNGLSFQAKENGTHYIRVYANSSAANMYGQYFLRVLPQHDEPNATWDTTTFEPNNAKINAYSVEVGREQAISSTFEPRNPAYATNFVDIDWYRFEAEAGKTYVIELFDVASNLASLEGSNCTQNFRSYGGVAMVLYNEIDTAALATRCIPSGAGDVHTLMRLDAAISGTHYIQIYPNSNQVAAAGEYRLRILPQHEEETASWDATTFEPNNNSANAYPIALGRDNALIGAIEPRSTTFSTNFPDIDWYRFQATAEQRYVVELFNVTTDIDIEGSACTGNFRTPRGLSLFVYDTEFTDAYPKGQCAPEGNGNVHSAVQFTATNTGWYYIRVLPNGRTAKGSYGIRVLPQYDQPAAGWDVAMEPNNRSTHAYPLGLERCDVRSSIEKRSAAFMTNGGDADWFVSRLSPVKITA